MSVDRDPALQAINDARALLETLLSNGWQEMHVVSGDTEIFLACKSGGPNPMRAAAWTVASASRSTVVAAAAPETVVKAPHVATLVDALPVGTTVTAGQAIATLQVLGESEAVEAPVSGTIVRHVAAAGELVDFGAPLVSIAVAA